MKTSIFKSIANISSLYFLFSNLDIFSRILNYTIIVEENYSKLNIQSSIKKRKKSSFGELW